MNKIIGKYKLVDYTMFDNKGIKSKWQGEQKGSLQYHVDGTVEVLIQRQPAANKESLSTAEKDKLYISYKARYVIISDSQISHTITESNHPERVGHVLVRNYTINERGLVITGKGLAGDVELIWQKQTL